MLHDTTSPNSTEDTRLPGRHRRFARLRIAATVALGLLLVAPLASVAVAFNDPTTPCDDIVIVDADGRTNRRATVIQAEGYGPICEFEREAIDNIIRSRGLTPNDAERAEMLSYGRDFVQTTTFAGLINLVKKELDDRDSITSEESDVLDWLRLQVLRMDLKRAELALAEYDAWDADKCNWQPPNGDEYLTLGTSCDGTLGGIFTGEPLPPSYEEFQAYGAYLFNGGANGDIVTNISTLSTNLAAIIPSVIAGAGLTALGAFLTLVVFAGKTFAKIVFPYIARGAVAGGSIVAAFVVVILLTIATVVRFVQVTDANQIRPLLAGDVLLAQNAFDARFPINLGAYIDDGSSDDEFLHLLTAFAAATAPRFAPDPALAASATPDPGVATPFFETTTDSGTTLDQSFIFALEDRTYRTWLSDRWWVIERLDQAEDRFLTPLLPVLLPDFQDALILFDGSDFFVTRISTDDLPSEKVTHFAVLAPPLSDPTDFENPEPATIEMVPRPAATVSGLPASRSIHEGQSVTISGTTEWAGRVEIDWSDGTAPQIETPNATTGAFTATRTFGDDVGGNITVTPVSPLDVDGTSKSIPLTVANVDPSGVTVTASVDGSPIGVHGANPDETVALEIEFTDPGYEDTHVIEVNWGDSTMDSGTPGSDFSHEYSTGGSKDVTVTVSDDDGGDGSWSGSILVNTAPQITGLPETVEVDEGSNVTFQGTAVDTNLSGIVASVFWGTDAPIGFLSVNATTGAFSVSRSWADDATVTPSFSVLDGGGLRGGARVTVHVNNVAPSITSAGVDRADGGSDPIAPLAAVRLSLAFEDPGVEDTHVVGVAWGDGSTESGAPAASYEHTYATGGTFSVVLTVTDDDGDAATRTIEVFVDATALDVEAIANTLEEMADGLPKADERRFTIAARLLTEVEQLLAGEDYRRAINRLRSTVIDLENLVRRGNDVADERDVVLDMLRAVAAELIEDAEDSMTPNQQARARELLADGDADRDAGEVKRAAGRYASAARLALR